MRSLPILLALAPLSATAATLDVGPAATYATIGDALAVALDGDVIEVEAGDYAEVLVIDNLSVDIVALQGPANTSISGLAAGVDMISIVNDSAVGLTGFELVANSPRAINVANSSLIATDLVVTGFDVSGFVDDGAGINCTASTLEIHDSIFDSNTAEDSAHVRLEFCDAIYDNSTFVNGIATDDGGVSRVDSSDLVVIDSWFEGNSANDAGGALWYGDNGSLDISGSTFLNNTAGGLGGATSTGQQNGGNVDVTVVDSTFAGNTGSLGGAHYHRGGGNFSATDNVYDGNSAYQSNGGAIRFFPDGVVEGNFTGNLFLNNTAADIGGGIAVAAAGFGGGSSANFDGNDFRGNDALRGGGASIEALSDVTGVGNVFCGNSSTNSGGGLRVTNAGGTQFVWTNNVFIENTTGGVGGGLAAFQTPGGFGAPAHQLVNNTFTGNDGADGGNAYLDQAGIDFVNNIFANAVNGGGMFSTTGAAGTLDYNLWFNNSPDDATGYLYAADLGPNSVFADPDFANYTQDGVCGNDLLTLDPGSPAIDAGDPSIQDTDGSTSDIGAFGGPNVPPGATVDNDGDGWPGIADCDDNDYDVNPDASEVCDGIDNNCDGLTDDASATGAMTWYPDNDGDGFGNDAASISSCYAPPNYIATGGDCADNDAATNPNATETCDGFDNDCNGTVDDGLTETWYDDADGDGYGDPASSVDTCFGAPAGTVDNGQDCDDGEAAVNPGAVEICDGLDNNCDAQVDEGLVTTWYRDVDADGYGNDENTRDDCVQPAGHVDLGGDCDDEDPDINPGAEDGSANQVDEDCDGKDGKKSADEALAVISGCGCSNTTTAPVSTGWLLLLGLAGLIRRRNPRG